MSRSHLKGESGSAPLRRVAAGGAADADVIPEQQPATLDECRRCPLWKNATQGVPGQGGRAPIMLVGEQPGDKEDLAGLPFVGPAGALLDAALQEAGIARDEVYITNAVKHFKWELRGKRRMHKTPGQREILACRYWLDDELERVKPGVIVALGATALGAVMPGTKTALTPNLGRTLSAGDRKVVPTYHPSFALRTPDREAREHAFQTIVQALKRARRLTQH
ncbi:UdgX family uracil-DNA binding protein [Bordetella genomosp. 13]|uniref:UdgX family uracil-DNA binding protein n=1 Tax=Bordetella genomosp. 13 TaxID=463040 RepID=UPI0011A1276F|nr:UdgX family uracil-DNA binding protein [Bordetella genomosp. 13]